MTVFVVLALLACHGGASETPAGPPETAVKVVVVRESSATDALPVTGTVEAEDTAEIRPESSGPVASITFDHGQKVTKGDVLLRLRDAGARAAVAEAEARLALANSQLERTRALFDRQNASRQDLDKADADRALAQAQLDRAREELRRTVVRAPFDGVVGLRGVAPGEVIDPSKVITRIEAVDRVVVDVEAPERWLPRLQVGLQAKVEIDALPGERFDAEVVFVGPRVSASTRTAPVRVAVPNPDGRLRPGMSAQVSVTTAQITDAILLPAQAVVSTASGSSVWVVQDGVATPRPVTISDRTAEEVRVASGLAEGDQVVVEGLIRLRPGAKVKILDEGGGAAPTAAAP